MITLEQWLELTKKDWLKETIFCVDTSCVEKQIREVLLCYCEYYINGRGACSIEDDFNGVYGAEDCFLTKEEAEAYKQHLKEEEGKLLDKWDEFVDRKVWVVAENHKAMQIDLSKVSAPENFYNTKEEAEAKANEYNHYANIRFGAEEETK